MGRKGQERRLIGKNQIGKGQGWRMKGGRDLKGKSFLKWWKFCVLIFVAFGNYNKTSELNWSSIKNLNIWGRDTKTLLRHSNGRRLVKD